MTEDYGYIFAHFREDSTGYAERIHFLLSDGDTPLRWRPLWGGRPVLTSGIGTSGVRDPALVRDDNGMFHILATDLRVWGGDEAGWDHWRRYGSQSLILWDSPDLLSWEGPRQVTVAPPEAGMAWAPEVTRDPATGEYLVFWSSTLFSPSDVERQEDTYSRILYCRTRDFVNFSSPQIFIDDKRDIIDTALIQENGKVYRFSKQEGSSHDSWGLYQEVGTGLFDHNFVVVSRRIGSELYQNVEAPIIVKDPHDQRWYLFLDQYSEAPQGYFVLESTDLDSGTWRPTSRREVSIPPATKHGTIIRLKRTEWERLLPFASTT